MSTIHAAGLAGPARTLHPRRLEVYTARHLARMPELAGLDRERRFLMEVVARVLPFRVNRYVLDELIDWSQVPEDPIFRLTFPQPEMLEPEDLERIAPLVRAGAPEAEIAHAVEAVRTRLNPHPAGQRELNVPQLDGRPLQGLQHKYRETVLFFPAQGQTCHSYCSFCFRWPQFVGEPELRFAERDAATLQAYLRAHPEVTDLLVTGGDPMVMRTKHLAAYLEPLLDPVFEHVRNIRIGTKALSFWPYRFLTDDDADALLRLFERFVAAGRHVAIMAHVNHWRELETDAARAAIERLRATGVVLRTQAPVLRHINDDAAVWVRMWREQVRLGMIPYYMFVERDTGARRYFELPLARAHAIYREAVAQVSGLARTVRGPSMSATPGKVEVQGVAEIGGERVFVLRFLQARDPSWLHRPFFARFDAEATWLDQLRPAFGEKEFFFEPGMRALAAKAGA